MIHSSSTTLPPISDIFAIPRRGLNSSPCMNYHHSTITTDNTTTTTTTSTYPVMDYNHITNANSVNNTGRRHHYHQRERTTSSSKMSGYYPPLKAKRKRASPSQLAVLNRVFSQTYFPSTELRIELGKHLGMSPRTVQIWFQNKRQSLRSKTRRYSFSSMEYGDDEEDVMDEDDRNANVFPSNDTIPPYPYQAGYPASPPWTPTSHSGPAGNDFEYPFILPPPSSSVSSLSSSAASTPSSPSSSSPIPSSPVMIDHHDRKINLPPLRLHQSFFYLPSPPSSTYPSPISIDSILQ
ncbi:hypothetical protein [Absidia glauca]|uniref:Homeobox domain-containing protein n=1 Tax=Absidia glauca TaxID=4829 RepID=A0A168S6L5_ABSGL|nr:hypothetical protein [Absidia glauca]